MTLYAQEPVKGYYDDATNAILKTIHFDDEDELDDSTDDEEDEDAMIYNNQTITTIIRIIILLTVINYINFMITQKTINAFNPKKFHDCYYSRQFNLAFCLAFANFANFSTRNPQFT